MNQSQIEHLTQLCIDEIQHNLAQIKQQTANTTLYAFALGLVEDITGFFTVANSIEALDKMIESEDDVSSYAWFPSEWAYAGKATNHIYHYLESILASIETDQDYDQLRQHYEQCLINALAICREQGCFKIGPAQKEVVVFLHYADDFNDDEISDRSSQCLNSPEQHDIFTQRFELQRKALQQLMQI
ncbi:uncharacterized protein DUF4303 [Acinetobacter calcoaceticus]|uniref:Uncharacterized protein DUF4303 n=1 Tax=Acinetobacter calcoaceticus TaxID=471 RepID=A0A4R1XVS2_ACICA|nr:uncharacterized protein DUF4303 [Acinetobacter calcoaceticus]